VNVEALANMAIDQWSSPMAIELLITQADEVKLRQKLGNRNPINWAVTNGIWNPRNIAAICKPTEVTFEGCKQSHFPFSICKKHDCYRSQD